MELDRVDARSDEPHGGRSIEEIRERMDRLVVAVQSNPDDRSALEQLARLSDAWVAAEGLAAPSPEESEPREALAAWISGLVSRGTIVHLGWRSGGVAGALGAGGAQVRSFLDHPGRAMAAAIRHGAENLHFFVLDEALARREGYVDMLVLETAGPRPVVPLEQAVGLMHEDTWLVVLGMPLLVDDARLCPSGAFRLSAAGAVQPCAAGCAREMLMLFRRVAAAPAWTAVEETASPAALLDHHPRAPAADLGAEALKFRMLVDSLLSARPDRS